MKILVAVASRHGSTHEIADALALELGRIFSCGCYSVVLGQGKRGTVPAALPGRQRVAQDPCTEMQAHASALLHPLLHQSVL